MATEHSEQKGISISQNLASPHRHIATVNQEETVFQTHKHLHAHVHTHSHTRLTSGKTQRHQLTHCVIAANSTAAEDAGGYTDEKCERTNKSCSRATPKQTYSVRSVVKSNGDSKEDAWFKSFVEVQSGDHHTESCGEQKLDTCSGVNCYDQQLDLELSMLAKDLDYDVCADDPVPSVAVSPGAVVFTAGAMRAIVEKIFSGAHASSPATETGPENSVENFLSNITGARKPTRKLSDLDINRVIEWGETALTRQSGQSFHLSKPGLSPRPYGSSNNQCRERQDRRSRRCASDCPRCKLRQHWQQNLQHSLSLRQQREQRHRQQQYQQKQQQQQQQPQYTGTISQHHPRDCEHELTRQTSQGKPQTVLREMQQTFLQLKPPTPITDDSPVLYLDNKASISEAKAPYLYISTSTELGEDRHPPASALRLKQLRAARKGGRACVGRLRATRLACAQGESTNPQQQRFSLATLPQGSTATALLIGYAFSGRTTTLLIG
ncbi:hypothetical protein EGW08_007243 [Elysia chlorotica]|uniref:Uncharacterized protein n=1 Tax=Elysia chlorotica TaxID=188477 RepID=A0A433TTV8_ELYCH|nr:hypothetical protein EGW08_007243 [Elysia chlorotica]